MIIYRQKPIKKYSSEPNCECVVCHKPLHRYPKYILKTKNITCSYECSYKLKKLTMSGENNHQYGHKGELAPSFKGEKRISHGYQVVYKPEHPFSKENHIREHRLIAEKYLLDDYNSVEINGQKYLRPEFVVHHIDFDKLNNDIINLCVMKKDDHSAMHISFKTIIRDELGRIKNVKKNFNTKEEAINEFYKYINNTDIYYHINNQINIPQNIENKGEN